MFQDVTSEVEVKYKLYQCLVQQKQNADALNVVSVAVADVHLTVTVAVLRVSLGFSLHALLFKMLRFYVSV